MGNSSLLNNTVLNSFAGGQGNVLSSDDVSDVVFGQGLVVKNSSHVTLVRGARTHGRSPLRPAQCLSDAMSPSLFLRSVLSSLAATSDAAFDFRSSFTTPSCCPSPRG